jgi:phage baseplate assembly protein gpV
VLLGLLENIDEVASLLSIYCDCMSASLLRWMKRDAREEKTYCQW